MMAEGFPNKVVFVRSQIDEIQEKYKTKNRKFHDEFRKRFPRLKFRDNYYNYHKMKFYANSFFRTSSWFTIILHEDEVEVTLWKPVEMSILEGIRSIAEDQGWKNIIFLKKY